VLDATLYQLDLRTLFLILAGIGATVAVAFATLSRYGAGGEAAKAWADGHGLAAAGYLLFALRGSAPPLLSEVVANLLILGGAMLILRALSLHTGRAFPDRAALAGFAAVSLLFVGFTFLWPALAARVMLVSVVGAAILGAGAGALLAPARGVPSAGHYFTAAAFAAAALALLARAGLTVAFPPADDLLGAPFFHGMAKAVLALASAAWSLGFLWLITVEGRRALEREVAARGHSERRLRAIFDASPAAIAFGTLGGGIQMANAAFADLLGRTPEELAGRHLTEFTVEADREAERQLLAELHEGRSDRYRLEKRFVTPGGEPVWVDLAVSVIRDGSGRPLHLVGVANEIGERKRIQQELEYRANFDPLTGLLNRLPFEQLLEQEQYRLDRYGSPASLVMFDVDHFKAINDRCGHQTGDAVLRELATVAKPRLRDTDTLARWGGEEFMLLLPETGATGAARAAEGLRRAVAEHAFPGEEPVTISLGLAELTPGESQNDLVRRADAALYDAKAAGRNCLRGQAPPFTPRSRAQG
jgi:diguanylate cyclase (GGDEF)-like protein/PAS domain S-box-containing protein